MKTSDRISTRLRMRFCQCLWVASMAVAFSLVTAAPASAGSAKDFGNTFAEAFKEGEFDVDFRYRYEFVDRESRGAADPVTENANASTLRTRLVYTSGQYKNLFVTLNMDDVRPIVWDDFNDTRNGKTQYPAVADPKGTDLNLASITYAGLEDGSVVLGRQRIIRDNARFVGNVGWRQNEQTYDSLSIDYKFLEKGEVFYAYVDQVKRIFGPDDGVPAASLDSNSHLFDARYEFTPLLKLSGYAYLLEFKNSAAFSSQTLGLRLSGKHALDDALDLSYMLSYAAQQDYKDNPNNYDEAYYIAEVGFDWAKYGVKVGYEVLGGSGVLGQSFQTPLATLHAHNGWADQFLVTPGTGLQDAYIKGTAKAFGGKFSLVYHDFGAETGGADYGQEVDFKAKWSFLKHYSFLVGFAMFKKDNSSPIAAHSDINKVWAMLSANF
jgi:hypothetical protein